MLEFLVLYIRKLAGLICNLLLVYTSRNEWGRTEPIEASGKVPQNLSRVVRFLLLRFLALVILKQSMNNKLASIQLSLRMSRVRSADQNLRIRSYRFLVLGSKISSPIGDGTITATG